MWETFMYADIVIIDSGIAANIIDKNITGIGFVQREFGIEQVDSYKDEVGHGTSVYNLIKLHNKEAKYHIIKIIGRDFTSEALLIHALQYVLSQVQCKIVNVSLGINALQEKERFYQICQSLHERGTIICSAFENDGAISFPAAFDNVLGVVSGNNCNAINDYNFIEGSMINFGAKGGLQRIIGLDGIVNVQEGNSYACAHMTGIISKIWKQDIQVYHELEKYLKENAKNIYSHPKNKTVNISLLPGKVASIFPFNKELHSLLRFQHLLPFSISAIYDTKYSTRIGANTNDLLGMESTKQYIINNIEDISYDDFDMLILGHVDQIINIKGIRQIIEQVLRECEKRAKKIYAFDDISSLLGNNVISTHAYYTPQLSQNTLVTNPHGMLYREDLPVLGVFGTSSQQGKFTLQLILRDLFLRDGYQVGQLGTEPSAHLFGMDECFHFGYGSLIELKASEVITHVNALMHNISEKKPDIVLVGSQSGTLPWEFGNISGYSTKQIHYLLATNPDAVVLCVNECDTVDVVRRTIRLIESIVDCKVIGLVVFPITLNSGENAYSGNVKLSEERYLCFKNKIEKSLRKPVFLLGNKDDMRNLYNKIINFF